MKARWPGSSVCRRVVIGATVCAALGCGDGPTAPSGSGGTPPVPSPTSLEITTAAPGVATAVPSGFPPHLWMVAGQSAQLSARMGFSDGSVRDVTAEVAWASTNAVVASVSPAGVLSGTRAGQAPIAATYQQAVPARTVVSVFNAPLTAIESFSAQLALRERHPYLVTVGAGGGDVVFVLTSAGPGSALLGVMFGPSSGSICTPPYTYGTSWVASRDAGTGNRADARTSVFQVSPGRYCVIVLDPATVTSADQLPAGLLLRPMNFPVSYTVTVGASGAGAAVSPGGN